MSRQKSRDERQEHPRERARTEGPGKRGAERREDQQAELRVEPLEVRRQEPSGQGRDGPPPGPGVMLAAERVEEAPEQWREEPPAAPQAEPAEESQEEAATAAPHRWVEAGLVTSAQARAIERLIGAGEPGPEALAGLIEAGILTRSQAGAVRRAQLSNGHAPLRAVGEQSASGASRLPGSPHNVRLPRLSLDARKLGVFLAATAFVGLVWAVMSVLTDALATPRRPVGIDLLDSLRLLAGLLALVGGRRMYRGIQNGKQLVLTGLVIYALASVLLAVRRLGDPVVIGLLLSWALLYYLTAVSRFRAAQTSRAAPGPD